MVMKSSVLPPFSFLGPFLPSCLHPRQVLRTKVSSVTCDKLKETQVCVCHVQGLEQVLDRTIDENSENYSDNTSMARPWPPAARAPIRGRANSPNNNTPTPFGGRGRTQSEHLPSLASLTRSDSAFNRGESAFSNRFSQLSRQWSRSTLPEGANE